MTIDYEAARVRWPLQKRELAAAQKATGENEPRASVERVIEAHVREWNEWGAWPDDWSGHQRALDDVRHWREQISLEEFMAERNAELRARVEEARAEQARRTAALYPEHERMKALNGDNDTIGAFLEWLSENDYAICEVSDTQYAGGEYVPVQRSIESWLAQYFNINPAKISAEKDAMLQALREAHEASEARA